jgi:hypothetical protein
MAFLPLVVIVWFTNEMLNVLVMVVAADVSSEYTVKYNAHRFDGIVMTSMSQPKQ